MRLLLKQQDCHETWSYTIIVPMKILYFDQKEIEDIDLLWGFVELGYDVRKGDYLVPDAEYTEEDVTAICKELGDAELIATKDFSAAVAEACHLENRIYLSWVHDSPQRALYMREAQYDTNIIFLFDRAQVERLSMMHIPHLYHAPLATNITRASTLHISDEDIRHFSTDIAFVGSMYLYKDRTTFFSSLSSDTRTELEAIMNHKIGFWDDEHTLFCPFSESAMRDMSLHLSRQEPRLYAFSDEYLIQTLALCRETATRERLLLLDTLSKKHSVALYTDEPEFAAEKLPDVQVHGRAHYATDALKVFYSSRVNLNITIPSIESGVPLRIYDIMGVGGFVMSNNQSEAHELFVPDREIVLFSCMDELEEKAAYYLLHDKQRTRIAMSGYQRVLKDYNIPNAVKRMVDKTRSVFGIR